MSDPRKDILANLNKDIEQDKLLEYLNKNLGNEEQHEFEKQMNDDEFMNDAVEGLQEIKDKKDITELVRQMNADLKKQLNKKKERKNKRKPADQRWVYYAVILLMILLVAGYIIIRNLK